MKSIARLKDKARLHEQKEEWDKAIQAYEQAIRLSDEGEDEVEVNLFNRIGDLHLRLGRQQDAVACYETAADRYADAGFFNNAIALCNKALRYVPDRAELYRKLGRYSAAQGFLTDARRWFLDFAERKQRAGQIADAFGALEEFADLSDDAEILELLAGQLEAHGQTAEAVVQFTRAYHLRSAAGETAAAESLRQRILDLNPDADLSTPPPSAQSGGSGNGTRRAVGRVSALPGLEIQTAADSAGIGEDSASASDAPVEDAAPGDADAADAFDSNEDAAELVDAADPIDGAGSIDSAQAIDEDDPLDATTSADEDAEAADAELLVDDEPADDGADEHPDEHPDADVEGALDLPELDGIDASNPDEERDALADDDGGAIDDEPPEPLPLLAEGVDVPSAEGETADHPGALDADLDADDAADESVWADAESRWTGSEPSRDEADAGPTADAEPSLSDPVAAALDAAREYVASGRIDESLGAIQAVREALAGPEELVGALAVLDDVVASAGDLLQPHQLRVEFASRLDEPERLVGAYLDMADCLVRHDAVTKAAFVFERVLDMDPASDRAREGLAAIRDRGNAGRRDDYVDLSALVGTDDIGPGSVEAGDPSDAEDADFSVLLSQFKALASERAGEHDAGSHYDLGLAFQEMGLIDEAIAEFQKALAGGEEKLKIYEELGKCFMHKEQYDVAAKILGRALTIPRDDDRELLGVYYHLGRCYEELGKRGEARSAFERVVELGGEFRDVSERLARL